MKMTKKQIDMIIDNTPQELGGSQEYHTVNELGYHMPSQANWSYRAVFIVYNGQPLLVVKQFGAIRAKEAA